MDKRRPIQAEVRAGADETERNGDAGVTPHRFREALARWASTVTVLAVRDADTGEVHATTVTSFAPVAANPPLVFASLGAGAQVLPFLAIDGTVGVSLLAETQTRWATTFADSFPVGSMPWSSEGPPVIAGATATLAGTVRQIHATDGGSRIVVCRVDDIALGDEVRPLLYWRRTYARLEEV